MAKKEGKTLGDDNIIEFNGKRYDAATGELLGKSMSPVAEGLPPLPQQPLRTRSIEGVVRHKKSTEAVKHITHKTAHRATPNHAKPHRPETAKTLMRRAVHKPKAELKPAIKPQAPAEIMAKPISHMVAAKRSAHQVDPIRKERAEHTPKSDAVKRFNHHTQPHEHHHAHQQHTTERPKVAAAPAARPNQYAKPDMFEAAIARANSHEQAPPPHRKHRRKHRAVSIMAGIAAFLIMGGFLAYLNMPRIELKIASISAGFSASMPSYSPTGYELADIENRRGKITLSFRSGESSYRLIQQPSNWTSQTLQDDIIASAGSKTIESKGRTIYIYDGVASWLSGDVRYDLTGNAPLDEQEIADIAAST